MPIQWNAGKDLVRSKWFSEQSYYYYFKKRGEDELSKLPVPIPTDNINPTVFKKLKFRPPFWIPDLLLTSAVR